jgi:hypothetical protein
MAVSAGCGGSSSGNATPPTTTDAATATHRATTTAPVDAKAALARAVRSAILEDHRMSVRVLWTNNVPKRPVATAGPALANLRQAVADRRRRGIRVRLISEQFRIVSLRLDPSYTRATAEVVDPQRVRPYGRDGRPLGRTVVLNEHVKLELRRVGSSNRFVVWKVVTVR